MKNFSLQIGQGSPVTVKDGQLRVEHGVVALLESVKGTTELEFVLGYALRPGETVRRTSKGVYVVEL